MSSMEPPGGERDRDSAEINASFDAIIAGWGDDEPLWPEAETERQEQEAIDAAPAEEPVVIEPDQEVDADEGHYEPPEPPPIPRPRSAAVGAMVVLGMAIILLFFPGLIGLTDGVGLPLGLLAAASGLFWLFLLLRAGPPVDSGWDDGSRL